MEQQPNLMTEAPAAAPKERKTNAFARFFRELWDGVLRFIVPVALSLIALLLCILSNAHWFVRDGGEFFLPILAGFGAGMAVAAMLQLWFEAKNVPLAKLWEALIALPVSAVLTVLLRKLTDSAGGSPLDYVPLIAGAVILVSALIGMVIAEKRGAEGGATRRAYLGVFWGGTLFLIVFSALMLFYLAIDTLLFELSGDSPLYILIFALLTVGCTVFLSFLPKPGEEERSCPKAYHILMTYVLLPLYLILLAILYVYIAGIVFLWKMPDGEMNPYGMCALAGFLALWLGLKGEESPLAKWYARWGGLLLLPVTVLQIVGLWIRIRAYGLTPLRVGSLAIVLLGLIAIALCTLRMRLRVFYWAAAAVAVVFLVSPLNVHTIANWEQELRLKPLLQQYEMIAPDGSIVGPNREVSAKDYSRLRSGIRYFGDAKGVLSPFAKSVRDAQNVLSASDMEDGINTEFVYFRFHSGDRDVIDLGEYRSVSVISNRMDVEEPYVWTDPIDGKAVAVDLEPFAKQLTEAADPDEYDTERTLLYPIDERHTMLIGEIEVTVLISPDGTKKYRIWIDDCWMLTK